MHPLWKVVSLIQHWVFNQYVASSLMFQAISQYLPRGDLRLRPAIYEMILHEFLKTDYEVLYAPPLQTWHLLTNFNGFVD